jgi:small subunit ribosomal protein S27Ae
MADAKKPAAKAAAPVKKGALSGVWQLFEKKGDTLHRKNKHCLKCGPGFFLAAHKDRLVCGKCGYVEYLTKA